MISIGIPAFKPEYLKLSIESALVQTFNDFELIILNSYANIEIREIVNHFIDPRIRYIESNDRPEIVKNWNTLLSYAIGEHFVLFSDDDVLENTFLEELYLLYLKFPLCNIFHCRFRVIDKDGKFITFSSSCPEYERGIDFIWHRLFTGRLLFTHAFMFKTTKLRELGGFYNFPLAWGSDDITSFLLANESGIAYTGNALINWRKSNINISQIGNFELRLLAIEKYKIWIENFLISYNPQSIYEESVLCFIKKNLHITIDEKNKNMVYKSSLNSNIFSHIYDFFKCKLKYRLKISWLISTTLFKIMNCLKIN